MAGTEIDATGPKRICAVRLPGTSRARFADAGGFSLAVGVWVVIRTAAGDEPARVVVAPDQWIEPVDLEGVPVRRVLEPDEFEQVARNIQRAFDLIDTVAGSLRHTGSQIFLSGLRFNLTGDTAVACFIGDVPTDVSSIEAHLSDTAGTRIMLEQDRAGSLTGGLLGGGPGKPVTERPDTFNELLRQRFDVARQPETFAPHGLPRLGSRVVTPQGPGQLVAVNIRHWQATVALDQGGEVTVTVNEVSEPE